MAFIGYKRLDFQLFYWRTNHGAEVDVLICQGSRIVCALEIKSSQNIVAERLGGLKSFMEDNPGVPAYVLGHGQKRRLLKHDIFLMNWDDFILKGLNE
jgi:predicted AAA+ superfamily ATPase